MSQTLLFHYRRVQHRVENSDGRTVVEWRGMTQDEIPDDAFLHPTHVMVEEGVPRIEDEVFNYMIRDEHGHHVDGPQDSLRNVTIPKSVVTIGTRAFHCCLRLEGVAIADESQLEEIEAWAFFCASSLKEIKLPSCLQSIGEEAFLGCDALTRLSLGNSQNQCLLHRLADRAFEVCKCLVEVDLSHCPNLRAIGDLAFCRCRSLRTVLLPPNLEIVGVQAFFLCHSLKSLQIPGSVSDIRRDAFSGSRLELIRFHSLSTIGSMVIANNDVTSGCWGLSKIEWPNNGLPIALWPHLVVRIFFNNGEPLIWRLRNCMSCVFSFLCEHREAMWHEQKPVWEARMPRRRQHT